MISGDASIAPAQDWARARQDETRREMAMKCQLSKSPGAAMLLAQSPTDEAVPMSASNNTLPPMAGLAGLGPGDDMDSARLMGVLMALAGEVYVLKAEVKRLRIALQQRGGLDESDIDRAGGSEAMKQWMAREEGDFARALLRPFTHPDEAPDVSERMQER